MRYFIFLLSACVYLSSLSAKANEKVSVEVTSLTNVRGNGSIEVCGVAKQSEGVKPLLVTVKHDESHYTTLTAPNDKWCVLIKRWTWSGKVDVGAVTLASPGEISFREFTLPKGM